MSLPKILKNKAQCKNCGDIIESKHVHDFVACKCYILSDENIAAFPKDQDDLNDPSGHSKKFWGFIKLQHGIAIDGGLDYGRRLFYNIDDLIDLSEYEEGKDE